MKNETQEEVVIVQQIPQELLELIHGGENITVEFKKSRTEVTKDVYETVCAFSNRDGFAGRLPLQRSHL